MLRVAIWDDRDDQLHALRASIETASEAVGDVELVDCTPADVSGLVSQLKARYSSDSPEPIPFLDGLDVLCIDYDLRMLQDQSWLTADALAGLVHAYSDCPCVVALNRPPRVAFDLTMIGSWEGPGALQVIPAAVGRETFWSPKAVTQPPAYRPWEWLDIRKAKQIFERRIADLEELKEGIAEQDIFSFLGFDKDLTLDFSWRALGALSPKVRGEDPRLSFAEFLKDGVRALPLEKLAELSFEPGPTRRVALRLIAFELGRWLKEQTLAGQDVLVDVPHLIARAPWLLGANSSELNKWNETISTGPTPSWLSDHLFVRRAWLDRDCYVWPKVQSDSRFAPGSDADITDTSPSPFGDFVFLEDASCFAERSNSQSFTASFGNIWDQRFVMLQESIESDLPYGPQVRFAI